MHLGDYLFYLYFIEYESDLNQALQKLREREFQAGRYNYNDSEFDMRQFEFPPDENSWVQVTPHDSIEDARLETLDGMGTYSILDVLQVGDGIAPNVAMPVDDVIIERAFETLFPEREMVEDMLIDEDLLFIENHMLQQVFESSKTGHNYLITYDDLGEPEEICFLGFIWID